MKRKPLKIKKTRKLSDSLLPRVIAMAYNSDGTPKRTVGFWYPDIETVWTKKMDSA
jgi:hypothetical protein